MCTIVKYLLFFVGGIKKISSQFSTFFVEIFITQNKPSLNSIHPQDLLVRNETLMPR